MNTAKKRIATRKRRNLRPFVRCVNRDRILQLSNDLTENINSGTREEWMAVAEFWRDLYEHQQRATISLRDHILKHAIQSVNWYQDDMRRVEFEQTMLEAKPRKLRTPNTTGERP
jgi:hypothetical protein